MLILINDKTPYKCSAEELREAFAVLHEAYEIHKRLQVLQFHPGERVFFIPTKGRMKGKKIFGEITKINQKTVSLRQENSFTTWKVSANLLTLAPEPEAKINLK